MPNAWYANEVIMLPKLTSSGLDPNVPLAVHQLGQWTAEAELSGHGRGLFAAVEHTPVAVLFGQSRQSINVEVDLLLWLSFVRLVAMGIGGRVSA